MIKSYSYLAKLAPLILFVFGLHGIDLSQTNSVTCTEKEVQPDTLLLDLESSIIRWKGTDMGGKHEGTISFQKGWVITANDSLTSGYFEVDMHSIEVTDMPAHEVTARRYLTEHLESEDFFLVEKFPVSTFKIFSTQYLKKQGLGISGVLGIRDVSKHISITAKQLPIENGRFGFESFFVIDRFEWNVAYQGNFWKRISSIIDNNLVHAEIELKIKLHFL